MKIGKNITNTHEVKIHSPTKNIGMFLSIKVKFKWFFFTFSFSNYNIKKIISLY